MTNCVNINSEEFKKLKEQFPNTEVSVLAAKVSLWQDSHGLDNFPTKENILENEKTFNSVTRNVKSKTHPVLSALQVDEITSSLLYIGLYDVAELSDVENQINTAKIEKQLILQLKKISTDPSLSDDEKSELVSRYRFILDDDYKLIDFWKHKIVHYVNSNFKLHKLKTIDKEEDDFSEDTDGNNAVMAKQSHEEASYTKATPNIKYIIGTIPDIKEYKDGQAIYNKGEYLGLPKFKDGGSVWNSITNITSTIVQTTDENGNLQDGFEIILNKLNSESKYKPELKFVADKLTKMSDNVKTQFWSAFAQQKPRYIDHVIETGGKSTLPISKISDSNKESKEFLIFNSWLSNYQEKFGYVNNDGLLVNDPEKAENFKNAFKELFVNIKHDVENKKLTNSTINYITQTLRHLGIDLNPNTINRILDLQAPQDNDEGRLIALRIFHRDFANAVRDIDKYNNKDIESNIIEDNKSFFKNILAFNESYFSKVSGEDSFVGAGGNKTYLFQNHSTLSVRMLEFQNGDLSYLNDLAQNDFSSESRWLGYLLDPENGVYNRQSMYLAPYGNFRSKSDKTKEYDSGDKASDLKPADAFIDQFNKQLKGYFIGLAEADKSQQIYIKGPELLNNSMLVTPSGEIMFSSQNNEALNTMLGYLSAELKRIRTTWEAVYGETPISEEQKILYYHTDGKGNPGNGFKSFLFPNLNLVEAGIKDEDGDKPAPLFPDQITKEQLSKNKYIISYLNNILIDAIKDDVEKAIEFGLINRNFVPTPDPNFKKVDYTALNIDSKYLLDKGYFVSEAARNNAVVSTIADYTINSIIGNIEQTMLFNMDPALYKVKLATEEIKDEDGNVKEVIKPWSSQDIFADFKKRIPLVTASGKIPRIFKDKTGVQIVRPFYTSAVINNINVGSSFFSKKDENGKVVFNDEAINEIHKTTGESIENIKNLLKPYLNINQTDAQAWITLDAYRERMYAYGKWTTQHEDAYQKIQNNEILTFEDKALLAQPLKTVHVEAKKHLQNVMNIHYNKQSEAVLLPFLTAGTELDNLRKAMEAQKVDHVIVLDGKKVGATGMISVIDDNGSIKKAEDIKFNSTNLSYKYLFLQQDLPPHGLDSRQVGSQAIKNVMSVVAKNEAGLELINEYHEVISKLSDLGLLDLKNKLGYKDDLGFVESEDGSVKFNDTIYNEFYSELSDNHLQAIKDGKPFDAIPIKNKLQNKLNALITKTAVKLKQMGGALIQISDLGMVGTEVNLKDSVKNNIIWLKDPRERLKPMHIEDGQVKPAQVLIPYTKLVNDPNFNSFIKSKFNKNSYHELTHDEIKSMISTKVLEGLSYRIPNQGPSSNDAFEIVGILPPEMGDSMIAFSDITTKTGSDFDIDKAYIILPNFYFDKESGSFKKIEYNPEKETEKGLQNRRLELMRMFLLSPDAYISVMSPLDDPWLSDLCADLFPEESSSKDLQFFKGTTQLANKNIFDTAKSLVGVIANHMSNQSLFLHENIGFKNYYLGKGMLMDQVSNKYLSLSEENWNKIIEKDPQMDKLVWDNLTELEQTKILECL